MSGPRAMWTVTCFRLNGPPVDVKILIVKTDDGALEVAMQVDDDKPIVITYHALGKLITALREAGISKWRMESRRQAREQRHPR